MFPSGAPKETFCGWIALSHLNMYLHDQLCIIITFQENDECSFAFCAEIIKTLFLRHTLQMVEWRGQICTNEIQDCLEKFKLFKMQ